MDNFILFFILFYLVLSILDELEPASTKALVMINPTFSLTIRSFSLTIRSFRSCNPNFFPTHPNLIF